jgi:hypothetical protein
MNNADNHAAARTPSGSKLVLVIFALAVLAGALSWLYRYRAAHDSTQFWGPNFALLIAEPSEVTGFELYDAPTGQTGDNKLQILDNTFYRTASHDLTSARGMVHLRNSILTDSNYRWGTPVETDDWRWGLRFSDGDRIATILFTEDFSILGRMNRRGNEVRQVDCTPMAETLREYFASAGIFPSAQQPADASNGSE